MARILGIAIGLGVALAGKFVGGAFYALRGETRFVAVKGLAEREVDADLAIWPITFSIASNELGRLQVVIDSQRTIVTGFLIQAGFDSAEISYGQPRIRDEFGRNPAESRYVATVTVTTRTGKIKLVKQTMERSVALVGRGIAMTSENWEDRTEFLFTGLNALKPQMIEEATKNAHEAAEKFSKDSGSKLGKIRSASQGLFEIINRDRNMPERKVVRVVTSVSYYLVDR